MDKIKDHSSIGINNQYWEDSMSQLTKREGQFKVNLR